MKDSDNKVLDCIAWEKFNPEDLLWLSSPLFLRKIKKRDKSPLESVTTMIDKYGLRYTNYNLKRGRIL